MEEIKQQEKQRTIDLSVLLSTIRRSWLVALCIAILVGAIGFCYASFFITPMYSSSVTMLVDVKDGGNDKVTNNQIVTSIRLTETISGLIVTDSILSPVVENLDLDISAKDLENRIKITEQENSQLIEVTVVYNDSKMVEQIAEQLKEIVPAKVTELFESGNVYVTAVDGPNSSNGPVSPNVKKITILCAIIAFVAVIAFAIIRYLFDFKFRSSEDVSNILGEKVLGVIPSIESLDETKNNQRRYR